MSESLLDRPIEYLKGVGPQRGEVLRKEANVHTIGDLLHYYPFRYIDKTRFHTIREIHPEIGYVQLKGTFLRYEIVGEKRKKRLVAYFTDGTGTMELVWFQGIRWISELLRPATEFIVFGKPNIFGHKYSIAHPELQEADDRSAGDARFQPVYNSGEKLSAKGLDSRGILRLIRTALSEIMGKIPETLSAEIVRNYSLLPRESALQLIHFPASEDDMKKASFRIKFEEFFFIQLRLARLKVIRERTARGAVFEKVGDHFNTFFSSRLPFPLTGAQKRVMKEIRKDLASGKQMNRLLQGDVGSGKTVVALMTMLLAIDNGYQCAFMAPTEILASQHMDTLAGLLGDLPVRLALLTGSTKAAQRKHILKDLSEGTLHLLLGTHAVLEDKVSFRSLGLVVIDEQHKFGVAQRAKLWQKNPETVPHVLVMTATPIPRTLAMTLYGDLDVSIIDELPPGRKPVTTVHRFESQRLRVQGFLKEQIRSGRQVYVVYPLIEESAKVDLANLYEGYEAICRDFPAPEFRVSVVHGRMTPADKEMEMRRFVKRETQIMVATTVIEVGVNVPNASVMVIENAERFGLSQLHQLRGRVGRGADQSYCILISGPKLSEDAKVRIQTMCRTSDGFEIAETDLRLRGPGEILGTRQSGEAELRLGDLARDGKILRVAQEAALKVAADDPALNGAAHASIREQYARIFKGQPDWGRVS
ncbi:MAG: ATP-dependent DNA helicase RecG [Bacteroidia bacterium]|nr:ATP-dependent DNA helicase RecG [Bacteroidia bacterium]